MIPNWYKNGYTIVVRFEELCFIVVISNKNYTLCCKFEWLQKLFRPRLEVSVTRWP